MNLRISSSIFLCALAVPAFAKHAPVEPVTTPAPMAALATVSAPGKIYMGIFGGGASSNKFNASQFGTAYYTEAQGGPLAVNAFNQLNSESSGFYGIQFGYQAPEIPLSSTAPWTLGPGAELEGFTMNNSTFNGTLTNDNVRVPEHTFNVSYPMSRNVFLANAVLTFNKPCLLIHPYVGLGIGGAIVRISGADAAQINPAEVGVNHYNESDSDSTSTFAGQFKLGFSYDVNNYVSLFADYRWLYLASTDYTFGSTVFPGHPETSSWQVRLDAQRYNMLDIGVRVSA